MDNVGGRDLGSRTEVVSAPALAAMVSSAAAGSEADRRSVVRRVGVATIRELLGAPDTTSAFARRLLARGVAVSGGVGVGFATFDAERALDRTDDGEHVVLVVDVTAPADEPGMRVASAIVCRRGGLASHAAVVARQWSIPAVCGLDTLEFGHPSAMGASAVVSGRVVDEQSLLAVDGGTGEVFILDDSAVRYAPALPSRERFDAVLSGPVGQVLTWADEIVADAGGPVILANADDTELVARSIAAGAAGVGLCRTEHQFLGPAAALLAPWLGADGSDARTVRSEPPVEAIAPLLEHQRGQLEGVLGAARGRPVTVRLLDAPLHEFLGPGVESNPMMGRRGVRMALGVPWLYRMQIRALIEAAEAQSRSGPPPRCRVMVPMVSSPRELEIVAGWLQDELAAAGGSVRVQIGTMIETPRAALVADRLARSADFVSFGTNDLTQLTWGFSRDDLDATVIANYLRGGVLDASPFETLDPAGVLRLMALAAETARAANPAVEVGACGEHGADPVSMAALVALGLDSVSVAPPAVPVARLAAAHAVLAEAP